MKLMTHIVCGYPDLDTSEQLICTLDKYSDYIEIQIPFSDPIADWPVIMQASQKALDNGFKVENAFSLAERVSKKVKSKLLFMTYANIIHARGIDKFVYDAYKAWISWFIVPDISPDNFREFYWESSKFWLQVVSIFTPTSTDERIKYLAEFSPNLAYVVTRTWVTWTTTNFDNELKALINRIRSIYAWRLAVWFWVKSCSDIDFLRPLADYAVIWSQIIRELNNNWIQGVDNFFQTLLVKS